MTKIILNNKFNINKLRRIKTGRNNFVYKVKEKKNIKVIKIFKDKQRFLRELNFLNFLKKKNIENIPKIEKIDFKNKLYICNYINGHKPKKIEKKEILGCINFIKKININNIVFPPAIDSCFSLNDHFKVAEKKIEMIKRIKIKDKKINNIFFDSYNEFKELKKIFTKTGNNFYKRLKKKDIILSPSDFGFHNIKILNKKLFFFDFEYSGIDDPKKLVCDFFCQPDYIIDIKYFDFFAKKVIGKNNYIRNRSSLNGLLKIHSIKWICILIKHLYNDTNKLNINFNRKRNKVYKYYKRIKSWKLKVS